MPDQRPSEYMYHIQRVRPDAVITPNGKKTLSNPHPEETFRRHLRQAVGVIVLMIAFLALAYLTAVQTWEWRHRKFTKDVPMAEQQERVRERVAPAVGISSGRPVQVSRSEEALQRAELLAREGDAHVAASNFTAAIATYTQALSVWPDLAPVYPKLGRLYLRTQAPNRARYSLEKAAQLYPNAPDIFNDLGVAFIHLGRYDRAVTQFDAALALDPDYAPAHFNKSLCRRAMGDENGALSALDRFLQLRPDDPRGLKEKAFFLAVRREYAGALELLNRAISGAPEWPAVYFDAAATAALMNRDADAAEFLRKAESLTSSATVYLALQQPAFSRIRSNEVIQTLQRDLLQRAKVSGQNASALYKPGTPEPLLSFQQVPTS